MGKRQIGDMQPGELVITILISEIAAIPIQDLNQPILTGVVAVFTLCFLEILISVLTMKSPLLRRTFYGSSAVIISNGVVDEKRLTQLRVTVQDLCEVLRNQGIFDLNDVKILYRFVFAGKSTCIVASSQDFASPCIHCITVVPSGPGDSWYILSICPLIGMTQPSYPASSSIVDHSLLVILR